MRPGVLLSVAVASCVSLLAGCGAGTDSIGQNVSPAAFAGKVFGGQQPIKDATVTVWVAGTSAYGAGATALASTTTDGDGNFSFAANAYTCPYAGAPVYITSAGGDPGAGDNSAAVLVAGLGACSGAHSAVVVINEVTTVMTALAMGHFFTTTLGGDATTDMFGGKAAGSGVYNTGLVAANATTIPNFLALRSGIVRTDLAAGSVLESDKIYSMANTIAACVNSTGPDSDECSTLFTDTTTPAGAVPTDTLQAAVQMVLYPYQNVSDLFKLATANSPFVGLSSAPNDWTVSVSYTSTAFGLAINNGTISNIDIDANGKVYFPTDTSTSHGIGVFNPATQTFAGPYATTLVHPQYIAITEQGLVYASDLGAQQIVSINPASNNATTTLATTGYTGPIAAGYHGSLADVIYFTGGVTTGLGNILYQYQSSSLQKDTTYNSAPISITLWAGIYPYNVMASEGSCVMEQATGLPYNLSVMSKVQPPGGCSAGGIAMAHGANDTFMVGSSDGRLCNYYQQCVPAPILLSKPIGIATDGDDNLWLANSAGSSVATFGYDSTNHEAVKTSTVSYLHGSAMPAPYGIAIDRSGNVWVSNAGCLSSSGNACTPGPYVLTELIGAAAPTMTPLSANTYYDHTGSRP